METQQSDHLSLAGLWAKRYVQSLLSYAWETASSQPTERSRTAEKLLDTLRFASSQAWSKTESLLVKEMKRHQIDPKLIDPWQIAGDSRLLFEKATECYTAQLSPDQFSVIIAPACGRVRQHYTATDPRILGFVSMQFHYTGQLLLEHLTPDERPLVQAYLKVMDDHLYMPLHRSYEAAAQYECDAPPLSAIRQLLPITTQLAERICAKVAQEFSSYRCYSGPLTDSDVRISSVRDVEMFQVYLCLCVLESNVAAVQQDLFPLCVMLYPPLNVQWELVRRMLFLLEQELQQRLTVAHYEMFATYLQAIQAMFAIDVFSGDDFSGDDAVAHSQPKGFSPQNVARSGFEELFN